MKEKDVFSELDFRLIVESAPNSVILIDDEYRIMFVNQQARQAFGYDGDELIGKSPEILIAKRFIAQHQQVLFNTKARRFVGVTHSLAATRKDGTEFPIEMGLTSLNNGGQVYIIAVIIDITERKKMEAKVVASEARFRQTLDNMMEGAQIIDYGWRYVYVNSALEKQAKFKKHELIGYTMMEKYPGIENTEVFRLMKKCMDERTPETCINEFNFPDGTKEWFELMIQPVNEGIFILSQDITDRKLSEFLIIQQNEKLERKVKERTVQLEENVRHLKESEEKFNKAFQASAAGIAITRLSDSKYIEVNEAFESLTGYTKAELINKTSVDLGIMTDFKKDAEVLRQIRSTGYARDFDTTIKDRWGKVYDVLGSCETITMNGENYVITVVYDITERKRAEQQLQIVNRELEAFSYSVSHDLRAPLRAMNGYAQMLTEDFEDVLNDEGKRLLNNIRYNASKMGSLIDDLLAFSRLGRKEPQKTSIDMNEMVEGVLSEIEKSIQHKAKIKIAKLHNAFGDFGLVHQVLFNLISNAIKYSSKKDQPEIMISSEEKDGDVIFSIRDNGAGFNMKFVDKLFGVFQRLHSSDEFEGTGVGLAIVQRIITKHGGRIWAEGQPRQGATFYFTLPNT